MSTGIVQTARGPIESRQEGQGPAVLLLHGSSSDCQDRAIASPLVQAGFRVITPSRPGYGRTPVAVGRTAQQAADAIALLLEALGIERASIVAVSTAGPTGIALAGRHPDRVARLVLESAIVLPTHSILGRSSRQRFLYEGSRGPKWGLLRLAARMAPRLATLATLSVFSTHDREDIRARLKPVDVEAVRRLFARPPSAAGALADWDHEVTEGELAAVGAPTLIVHCREDRAVPFPHAERARAFIAGAQLFSAGTWGHFLWFGQGAEEVTQRVIAFLKGSA